jgi:hypothetical protein
MCPRHWYGRHRQLLRWDWPHFLVMPAACAIDRSIVDDRIIRASLGTTKYCSSFLRGQTWYVALQGVWRGGCCTLPWLCQQPPLPKHPWAAKAPCR